MPALPEFEDLYEEVNAMKINDLLIWEQGSPQKFISALARNAFRITSVIGTVAYQDTLYIVCVDKKRN